jgi:uncharacterized protein (TIGR00251 family)
VPDLDARQEARGLRLRVRVVPRAPSNRFAGVHGGALRIHLTAPPEAGKANRALQVFLGRALRKPPGSVEILKGAAARDKVVWIEGATLEELWRRLEVEPL